jgi:hypothetical protein
MGDALSFRDISPENAVNLRILQCLKSPLSLALLDSSPKGRALGNRKVLQITQGQSKKNYNIAKASPCGRGGSPQG